MQNRRDPPGRLRHWKTRLERGRPLPLGAWLHDGGINFALFSRHAKKVELLLYDAPDAAKHQHCIPLDPNAHRTGDIWHVWVDSLRAGQAYAYRVDGAYRPESGMRYNRHKLLIDPYATALAGTERWDFGKALGYDPASPCSDVSFWRLDNEAWMPRCMVVPTSIRTGTGCLPLPWPATGQPSKTPMCRALRSVKA